MRIRIAAPLAVILTIVAQSFTSSPGAPAAPRAVVSEELVGKEVETLERRFFPKTYWNDPLDKRLERLELMIYGATQNGSMAERLDRLKKDVTERSRTAPGSVPRGLIGKPGGQAGSASQYPVLNTLEWRALKKTYPTESLDQRLGRLESHLFGQPSTTMPYVDRIDRLKRVMGMGMTSEIPNVPVGPLPKARPRTNPFGANPSWINPSPFMAPDLSRDFPNFDSMPDFGDGTSDKTLADIMKKMHQHMAELRKMGPGSWTYDPKTRTWTEKGTGRRFQGDGIFFAPVPMKKDEQIPPYLDPNSI